MESLSLRSKQEPGIIALENFDELKLYLSGMLDRYENVVYTEDKLKDAKNDKKELTHLRKELDDRRKEIKRAYLEPYNAFEAQIKELLQMIDTPLGEIKNFVSSIEQQEKDKKAALIEEYYFSHSANLGTMAQEVYHSPAFFDQKWLNKTTSAKAWQSEIDDKIAAAAQALNSIRSTGGQYAEAMTNKYLENMSLDGVSEFRNKLVTINNDLNTENRSPVLDIDQRIGYKVMRVSGTPEQMAQVMELLSLSEVEMEVVEDGMPQPMRELKQPDFDSFVAFDLETSGTYGAANSDQPAEITEIGAVKVEHGKVTGRFSMLVNPVRKIVPRIARITHITDEMVADAPHIESAIHEFADFIGDSILVGHNIKASDLYYIDRAAKRAGIRIENQFFDTYLYAKTMKQHLGWKNVKLEYLSQVFGLEQQDAHRAWCDAEANVGVYFKLQELGTK